MVTEYLESNRKEADAVYVETVKAGDGWMHTVKKGQVLRIVDVNGNQAVDTIFYNADDIYERYSVQQTVQAQRNALVGLGTELRSNDDNVMLKVVADTCGDHDTLGSACSCESNMIRYGFHTRYMHACRETFLAKLLATPGMDKRDQVNNLNFFMYVPLDAEGRLNFADGISSAQFCRRHLLSGEIHRTAGDDEHHRSGVELPAAEQSLQRLRPDAGQNDHLG